MAFNVLMLINLIEQVERGAGSGGKTEKTQVTKPRHNKEESGSEESDFWMLKSSSDSESDEETDEGNCKGCFFFLCWFYCHLISKPIRFESDFGTGSHCDAKESEELSERYIYEHLLFYFSQSSF